MLFCAFLLFSTFANAQSDSDTSFYQLGLEDLTSITVASNVATEKDKQPVSITTISAEQLRMSGARILSEAIMMYVPGFFLVEDQDDLIAGFRGMAADNNSKVLLLMNGQSLNTEFFWGPADAILNSTNFEYIERVEVIRGPGSVTLGQGALLGVINVITKNGKAKKGSKSNMFTDITASIGKDGYAHGSVGSGFSSKKTSGYFYLSSNKYNGQTLRNEGWAAVQGNQGYNSAIDTVVALMGHKLRKTNNITMTGNVQHKNFELGVLYANQTRDLYNFYRDREISQQILAGINGSYNLKITPNLRLRTSVNYSQDHFVLSSNTKTTMGGTREDRYGAKSILNIDNLIPNNKLAVGVEWRNFSMGKRNFQNNNFIANVVNGFDPAQANQELSMGFEKDISVWSVFLENFYSPSKRLDFFFAIRNDYHPFWGNSFTPRLGAIFSIHKDLRVRATYQTGFRGAVGLHYTGGYRNDGFLRADNYGEVANANIPDEANIPETAPEKMQNIELALNYKASSKLNFEVVTYYSSIQNVIDVGVIYQDPGTFPMVPVGSDIPGDWNGYWYFKNTPGNFSQFGAEISGEYKSEKLSINMSHALVKVATATQEQKTIAEDGGSMYLAKDGANLHFKAFPENVTRLSMIAKPIKPLSLGLTSMLYSKWYSPIGTTADGGFVANLSVAYQFSKSISLTLTAKNILNEQALYPMNSNAGGPDVSPGSPAWETQTLWATLRFSL